MIFWEIAKRNLRIHMLRSTLAMLGIVIGVVAIASMGILGNSMVATVSESLSSVGDSVIVSPYSGGGGGMGPGGGGGGGSSVNLKLSDQQLPADQTSRSSQCGDSGALDIGTYESGGWQ